MQYAERAIHGPGNHSAQLSKSTLLVVVDMATGFADQFVAWPAVHANTELIRHRPGWDKQRRLFAQQFGSPLLQTMDAGIIVKNIVAHFRLRDRSPHLGSGLSNRIATQINHAIQHPSALVTCSCRDGYLQLPRL